MNRADKPRSNYQAYLLRLWRDGAQTPWRASLQSTATERKYHFATLEALFAFLDRRLAPSENAMLLQPDSLPEDT
jgi:hypothetical protein